MNKLIILLLVVCLVSVQAFVKRETQATPSTQDLDWKNIENQLKDIFDPAKIQKGLEQIMDRSKQAINSFTNQEAPKA